MQFFTSLYEVISSLSLVDYILFFAVVTLIILFVSLIYVIKTEKLEKEEMEPEVEENFSKDASLEEEFDLQKVIDHIDENPKPLIDMTAYENEQEKSAIISYDELLKEKNRQIINYDKEEMVDDLIPVKKISLNKNENIKIQVDSEEEPKNIHLFSYEKEEAFLKALQQLNELLN